MRAALIAAALLVAPLALLVATPTAAAMGGPCIDPCLVVLVVMLVLGCVESEANYVLHGTPSCWGVVSTTECAAARAEQMAGLGPGCA